MFRVPQLLPRLEMNPAASRHANADDFRPAMGARVMVGSTLGCFIRRMADNGPAY